MITQRQLKKAEAALDHAHQTAITSHECYALLLSSHKKLLRKLHKSGISWEDAINDFEQMMQEHSERFNVAMAQMDQLSAEYDQLLKQYKRQSSHSKTHH